VRRILVLLETIGLHHFFLQLETLGLLLLLRCWRRIRPTSAPVPGEAGLAPSCAGDVSRAPPAAAAGVASGPPSPPGKLRSLFSCCTHFARALLLLLQVETLGSRLVFLLRALLRTRVRAAATLPRRRLLVLEQFCEIVCLCLPDRRVPLGKL
jgi:hypothetical protein